jgi:hypothetical protein
MDKKAGRAKRWERKGVNLTLKIKTKIFKVYIKK